MTIIKLFNILSAVPICSESIWVYKRKKNNFSI